MSQGVPRLKCAYLQPHATFRVSLSSQVGKPPPRWRGASIREARPELSDPTDLSTSARVRSLPQAYFKQTPDSVFDLHWTKVTRETYVIIIYGCVGEFTAQQLKVQSSIIIQQKQFFLWSNSGNFTPKSFYGAYVVCAKIYIFFVACAGAAESAIICYLFHVFIQA